ncbi:hypothetical protein HT102_03740 [Hoyosella sp. G463]|uniref:YtxH domain-containing protein n=1 Tax=Lolliginicoccus lacisalsi TaxID=2742202 RepID=A0A927PLP5_9ACTN|nr:hypothetical protein [Lolliginicoccus lacisalsi]MBD8505597.1 hypothetical protein [Lolliginicoccus lacisalsi]
MIGVVVGVAAGYVLGTRAGRERYEQLNRVARTIATSPATKKAVAVGRQKLSEALSTAPQLERVAEIDETTSVYAPQGATRNGMADRDGAARSPRG